MFRPLLLIGTITVLVFSIPSQAQILYSNGSQLHITTGAIVLCNGGVELAQSSNFTNNGSFTVTKNSTFPSAGNFTLNSLANAAGNGNYRIEQDWVNNAQFSADNSSVELYGNTVQNITSTNNTVTTFNNLALTGTGTGNNRKKVLVNVDARVGTFGNLTINDRELATETNTFYVLNPSVACVTNSQAFGSEGFVSSLTPGYFARATNSASAYLFPTGSSVGTLRYRPLVMTPSVGAVNAYNARLNNHNATPDGFDANALQGEVCAINPLFYHSLLRTAGNSPADIAMFYIPSADGSWSGISHWKTSNNAWNSMASSSSTTVGGFNTITESAWAFPDQDHPYVLSTIRPAAPSISNCASFCIGGTGTFTATGSSTGYLWTLPAGAALQSGQGSGQINVQWNANATASVSVVSVGTNGCNSLPVSCTPQIFLNPTADFIISADGQLGANYQFTDASSLASQWAWSFGDGGSSSVASPQYVFPNLGQYNVTLTVTSKDGCTAQITKPVVVEGDEVFIPNSFTPNDDFVNEGYRPINRSGENLSFSIFNRWGERIYQSHNALDAWDGSYGGKPCPLDVYICKVEFKDAKGTSKVLLGNVNLIK